MQWKKKIDWKWVFFFFCRFSFVFCFLNHQLWKDSIARPLSWNFRRFLFSPGRTPPDSPLSISPDSHRTRQSSISKSMAIWSSAELAASLPNSSQVSFSSVQIRFAFSLYYDLVGKTCNRSVSWLFDLYSWPARELLSVILELAWWMLSLLFSWILRLRRESKAF